MVIFQLTEACTKLLACATFEAKMLVPSNGIESRVSDVGESKDLLKYHSCADVLLVNGTARAESVRRKLLEYHGAEVRLASKCRRESAQKTTVE